MDIYGLVFSKGLVNTMVQIGANCYRPPLYGAVNIEGDVEGVVWFGINDLLGRFGLSKIDCAGYDSNLISASVNQTGAESGKHYYYGK